MSEIREYTRGQLADLVGCGAETIRYYETNGLLPAVKRAANGYRIYDEDNRKRLDFVLKLRRLGFSVEESRNVCSLIDRNDYTCDDIHAITVEHLNASQQKIRELKDMERKVRELADLCEAGSKPDCPIIDALCS